MGIDARIIVRVKRELSTEELRKVGYNLGIAFGPDRFWYGSETYTWRDPWAISRIYGYGGDGKSVCPKDGEQFPYRQDGPDIEPEDGEFMYGVYVWTRYWGPAYQRGDIAFIVMLAEWLERHIEGCQVWYGGDSSGVLAQHFDKAMRDEYMNLWALDGEVYGTFFDNGSHSPAPYRPKSKVYSEPMIRNGYGGDFAAFYCPGSGEKAIWEGGRWLTEKEIRARA